MKMKMLIASIALSPLFFASCKKESDANPSSEASSFAYQLKTINRTTTVGRISQTSRTEAASLQWTSGTASANELKFEAENPGGEIEFKQKTAQQIDLFAATSSLGNITIPAGTYNEVEFKAFLAPTTSAPALELSGSFTSSGVTKPVIFRMNSAVELKAEKKNVTVASGTSYSALNTIDLSQLISGVSESALTNATTTNGTIVISANANSDIYNIILNNLNSHHGEAEVEHH